MLISSKPTTLAFRIAPCSNFNLLYGFFERLGSILVGKSLKNQTVHAQIPSGYSVDDLQGKIVPVKINEARTWYLRGEVIVTDEFNQ